MKARWPDGVRCLACDHDKCYLIETKGKTGKVARLFECAECALHFSATTGTLFHDSHMPLQKWFMAIALMTEAKKGISAAQVGRHIGVTYKTAWYVCHRIRQAMQEESGFSVGGSQTTVEIDEMYVGGRKRLQGYKAGFNAKTVVLGLAEREGNIHMQRVPSAQMLPIKEVVNAKLDPQTQTVITDGKTLYTSIIPSKAHVPGNHKKELKSKNYSSTYTVESAFSLFKRGIVGNYHKLSAEHLDRYLNEFCWRYNRRHKQAGMFDMALTNLSHSKPLPYKVLTYDPF